MTTDIASPDIVASVAALGPQIRAEADATEANRRISDGLRKAIQATGAFQLCVPKDIGGLEADPATLVRVIEEISKHDGSTGWVVMIGASGGIVSGTVPEDIGREVFGPGKIVAGVVAPKGRAVQEDGGWRISGRWPFASGCEHADYIFGASVEMVDGQPRTLPEMGGMPAVRQAIFKASDVTIHDTWRVSGLRGTGSHDFEVKELFVPDAWTSGFMMAQPTHPGPLYRFPVFQLLALAVAAVPLGIARRALDEVIALGTKTPTFGAQRLADKPTVQDQVARAEADLRAGRAFLFETIGAVWDCVIAGKDVPMPTAGLLQLACAHTTTLAARAIDAAYLIGGGTSVYETSALQRCMRDVHAVTQHVTVAPQNYENAGKMILGGL